MATGGNEISSDEIPDFQCLTCTNKTAVKYCVECQGYCCQGCVAAHSRFPTLKGHKLLDISRGQTIGSSANEPSVPTERCSKHAIKILDMYCQDHDDVGCTTCMALDHRSCKNVHSIPDEIDILFSAPDSTSIKQNIKRSKHILNDIGERKEKLLKDLELSKIEADDKIENARKEIVDHVLKFEKKAKEEVQDLYLTNKARFEKEKVEEKTKADDLEKVLSDLQISEGNKAQYFVSMKLANRKIKEVDKIKQSLGTMTEAKITFEVDSNLQTSFKSLQTLGKVNILLERTELYTVEKYTDFNVKVQQDSTSCNIRGSCWTQDGALLLVEFSNKKLKRVNVSNFTVDSYCRFDSYPYCVCCTQNKEAVVTFYNQAKYIQFVSIGNQLTPSRKVSINHNCMGIAYKEDKLYICDNAQTLYIHDLAGNVLQTVSEDASGKSLFTNSRAIAFNDSKKGIFVADWNKGVIILDEQYQQVAVFSDSVLSNATSVCTDDRRNVFVCGCNSHNVLQIGTDGSKRGVVVDKSHGLQYPQSVLYDTNNCRLIVPQANDIVKIFYLK